MCLAIADVFSGWATCLQGELWQFFARIPCFKFISWKWMYHAVTHGGLLFFRQSTLTVLTNWRRTWWATTSCSLTSCLMQKHQHGSLTAASWWDYLVFFFMFNCYSNYYPLIRIWMHFFVLFQDREAGVAVVSPVSERTISAPGDHLSVFCLLWNEPDGPAGLHQNV